MPEEVKQERRARFMQLQERISAAQLQRKIGRTLTVLVDEVGEDGAVARSAADAPEIDGLVYVEDADGLEPGQFARVTVRRADEHDLYATRARVRSSGRLRRWAAALKRDVLALWFCCRDPRTPLTAKLLAMLIVGVRAQPDRSDPGFHPRARATWTT